MRHIWTLIGADGMPYPSAQPGTLGGHCRSHIYGRLDCPSALRAIRRGGYIMHRVFFLNEEVARAAGYRPCAVCMPMAYASWKAEQHDRGIAPDPSVEMEEKDEATTTSREAC